MNNLKSQGVKSIVWDLLAKLSTHGISFLVTVILARILEPNDFGLIAIVMAFVGISHLFTDAGLSAALIQKQKLLPIHYTSVFYFNISAAIFFTSIAYILSGNLARYYQQPDLEPLAQTMSIIFILNALNAVQLTRLKKQLNFAPITKASIGASVFSSCLSITLALTGFGIWSLVVQAIVFNIVFNISIWSFSKWRPSLSFSFLALTHLWKFGFRMFISGLLDAIYSRIDYLIIGKLFNTTNLGHFQIAKQFNLLINHFTSGSMMEVLFPALSKIQNQKLRFEFIVVRVLHLLCFAVFLFIGLLYCSVYEIVNVLYSSKWLQSAEYMSLLLLSGFSYPISSLLVNILKSRGNSAAFLKLQIIKKGLHTVNFITLIYMGINEFLYGLILVAFLSLTLNAVFVSKEINLKIPSILQPILVQMLLSIFSCVITLLILSNHQGTDFNLIILKSILFGTIYIGLCNLIKTKSSIEFNHQICALTKSFLSTKC